MIKRILEVEVRGFRSILERQTVSFNADVVILYGPNGTGKSGLLSAIEYGLTGSVIDLARFGEDYPRCLTHVRSEARGEVAVSFLTEQGTTARVKAVVGQGHESQQYVSEQEKRSYAERCFLSQARLHRLLDTYLAADEGGGEQRLIRFGRELLGLDLLEDLAGGLFEIADIRRIRGASQTFQQLLAAKEIADEAVERLERSLQLKTDSYHSALQSFQQILGGPEPAGGTPAEAETPDFGEYLETREGRMSADRTAALSRLRSMHARLQNAVALLKASSSDDDVESLEGRQVTLDDLKRQRGQIESVLETLTDGLERDITPEDQLVWNDAAVHNKADRIDELETLLNRRLISIDAEIKALDALAEDRRKIEARLAEITSALALLSEMAAGSGPEQRRWLDALHTVISRIHGSECPVCGRDYSELNQGQLKEKVLRDAEAIADMLQAAERDVSSQALLQADQRELGRRLETLSAQVDRDSGRRQELERTSVRYRQRLQAVVSAGGVRARWKTLAAEIRQLESTILDRQVKLSQMKHALADIEAIASEAGITASPGVVSWQRAGQVIEILSAQIGKLQLEEEKSLQIRERAKLARLLDLDVRGLREQLDVQEEKRATLDRGCQHVDLIIQRARSLRTAAIEAKSDLLNQAFTGTLNGLWREFFDRLVRTERFHPEMSQPTTIRNVIHANVCGVTSNSEPFLNIASVLSSGNLNTAALSLFFALHVMDRTSHSILVLDDPVQSVDDVHVSQMAILLRSLMTPIGRQSVVAAHDRDLFDYLSLELAPTEEGRSLITIELQRSTPESDVTIIQKTKTWTPSIRFGT